ncbi:MAG: ABC transporter permease [Phycisphaerales bacterium]|nr:ABC transporter permease [Phycisphaerales bacterium]
MIFTIFRVGAIRVYRDWISLGLAFVLPIVFFTILALVFGGMTVNTEGNRSVKVMFVDLDDSSQSRAIVNWVKNSNVGIMVIPPPPATSSDEPPTKEAWRAVRTGHVPAAVIIPKDFGKSVSNIKGGTPQLTIYTDEANPITPMIIQGTLQAAMAKALPEIALANGYRIIEKLIGPLTLKQQEHLEHIRTLLTKHPSNQSTDTVGTHFSSDNLSPVKIQVESVHKQGVTVESGHDMVTFYAAGIAVTFLLFTAMGAGGTLLEEEEIGVLERLMDTRVGMTRLLLGKWLFLMLLSFLQVIVMFIFAEFVFGVALFTTKHIIGLLVVTLFTVATSSGFGLLLATICKTRAQLAGIGVVVILMMSAIGGSMFPAFMMPNWMQTVGIYTFNHWAVQAYQGVFWYDNPDQSIIGMLGTLWPEYLVLTALTFIFLAVSRFLARRWEIA